MRLSTNTIFSLGTQSMLDQQSNLSRLGQQLSTQRRMISPSDDPRAAAQAVTLSQASQQAKQYEDNRAVVGRHLKTEENQLDSVNNALQAAKPLLVQASTGTLSDGNRDSIASALQGVYDQMLSSANAKDGSGRYIFGGFKTDTQPFTGEPGAVEYKGDKNQRLLEVDGSRRMELNDPGSVVFTSTTASSAYVATAAKANGDDNGGSAIYKNISVSDASAEDFGHAFEVSFTVSGEQTKYTVKDTSPDPAPENTQTYVPGDEIKLGDGLTVRVEGKPAAGDQFTVARGRKDDNNILKALADVIGVLCKPSAGDAAQARLTNTVNRANRQTDNALDNISSVRATLGTRLDQIDKMDTVGANQQLNLKTSLSAIQDIDLVSSVSDYQLAKVALQASQSTFMDIQKLSLFNFR